jgi:beta-lactam-binding protein with PASTA domain
VSKTASVVLGVIVVIAGGGAYAYQELGWFKSKPEPPPEPEYKKYKAPTAGEISRKSRHVVPDLVDLDVADARSAVAKAGFTSDTLIETDAPCEYANDKDMKPIGAICLQAPQPGVEVSGHTKIEIAVEVDTFEQGGVGRTNAWRRMPDLTGETLQAPKQILRDKGFDEDEFEIDPRSDCAKGTVCGTRPEAGLRKVKAQKGILYVP